MRFQETLCDVLTVKSQMQETIPENGQDVKLKLVVQNKNKVDLPLSITVSVQAIKHNGTLSSTIKKEMMEVTLQRSKGETVSTKRKNEMQKRK